MTAGVRRCDAITEGGEPCRAAPLRDERFCFWHSPEHQDAADEARRLGGLRRRRESTLQGVYDLEGLDTVAGIRRLIEIAAVDALGLENSVARARTLAYLAHTALKALEAGEFAARLAAIEETVQPRLLRGRR